MREVVFKNLTSVKSRKKDILLKDTSERDGIMTKTERRCFYFIKDISHLNSDEEFKNWLALQEPDPHMRNRRHFYIMRVHKDDLGDKVLCKVAGTFYIVINKDIYTIGFLHSFKATHARSIA